MGASPARSTPSRLVGQKRILLFVAMIAASAGVAAGCEREPEWTPPTVVRITSNGEVGPLFPSWISWVSDPLDGESGGLLIRDGEYLAGDQLLKYRAEDGMQLVIAANAATGSIGGVVVAVDIGDASGLKWAESATDEQLGRLRTLAVQTVDDRELSVARRIARLNPEVELFVGTDDGLRQVLPLFHSRALFLDSAVTPDAIAHIKGLDIDTLMLGANAPGAFDVLPSLPNLRRLLVSEWKVAEVGPLPAGMEHLESLVVAAAGGLTSFAPLDAIPAGLTQLSVTADEDLVDLAGLARFSRLTTLSLASDRNLRDLTPLADLRELRWLVAPPALSQAQLAVVAAEHPELVVLDMSEAESVTSLAPLGGLRALQAVVVGKAATDLEALKTLPSLRYVGIAKDLFDASPDQVAALRRALPDALIVRISPFCLGSGWLLLVLPAVLGARSWRRRVLATQI